MSTSKAVTIACSLLAMAIIAVLTHRAYVTRTNASSVRTQQAVCNWESIPLSGMKLATGLACGPHGEIFLAQQQGGVLKSTDGGRHWIRISGLPNCWVEALIADRKGNIYVGTGSGIYRLRSTDTQLSLCSRQVANVGVESFAVDIRGNVYAFLSSEDIIATADAGSHWRTVSGKPASDILLPILAADSQGHLFIQSHDGVWSANGHGGNWASLSIPHFQGSVTCLRIDQHDHIFVGTQPSAVIRDEHGSPTIKVSTDAPSILVSHDSGHHWRTINLGSHHPICYNISISKDGVIFAATSSGIYASFDDGAKWVQLLDTFGNSTSASPPHAVRYVASDSQGNVYGLGDPNGVLYHARLSRSQLRSVGHATR